MLFSNRVIQMQDVLQRQILIENLSSYVNFNSSQLTESEFLNELVARTDCGLLLDINNFYVNQLNHGIDAHAAIQALNLEAVQEIHLAGHFMGEGVVIDHHGDFVADAVWHLYRAVIERTGLISTLIEWDTDIPSVDVLIGEANKARTLAQQVD